MSDESEAAAREQPVGESTASAEKASKQKPTEVASFIGSGGLIGEVTFDAKRQPQCLYAVWKNGGELCAYWNECCLANGTINVPPTDRRGLMKNRVVLLPSEAADYGSEAELIAEITAFIHRYADVPALWEELIAHYVLMTWVYDRFSAIPYLRFLGEPQSGKTRCLQVAAHLCYKSIMAGGATTASPFFRLLEIFHGTFVIDEADYERSDLSSEIIKILNCGYMRGLPVLRSEKSGDEYEPRAFNVFGPKILATRKHFEDDALETRCLTLSTADHRIRPDIPRQLSGAFYVESQILRNKLLRWRFDKFFDIRSDESELLSLEPRLTQIGAPLYAVSTDDGFRARLLVFLADQADEQHGDRPQAIVAEAIRQLLVNEGRLPTVLTIKKVTETANEVSMDWDAEGEFSAKRVGGLVRSLGFATRRTGRGFEFTVTEGKRDDLIARYPPPHGHATAS